MVDRKVARDRPWTREVLTKKRKVSQGPGEVSAVLQLKPSMNLLQKEGSACKDNAVRRRVLCGHRFPTLHPNHCPSLKGEISYFVF